MTLDLQRFRKTERGFTLAELLVAIFVVAVGILGTISALWYGIRSEKYADRRANAVFQARELLNNIRSNSYAFDATYLAANSDLNDGDYDNDSDDASVKREYNHPPFANLYPTNPYNFKRHVEMKLLSGNPNDHLNDLSAIKVTMFWNEGGAEKKITLRGFDAR